MTASDAGGAKRDFNTTTLRFDIRGRGSQITLVALPCLAKIWIPRILEGDHGHSIWAQESRQNQGDFRHEGNDKQTQDEHCHIR
jgi:hypothetical protein